MDTCFASLTIPDWVWRRANGAIPQISFISMHQLQLMRVCLLEGGNVMYSAVLISICIFSGLYWLDWNRDLLLYHKTKTKLCNKIEALVCTIYGKKLNDLNSFWDENVYHGCFSTLLARSSIHFYLVVD